MPSLRSASYRMAVLPSPARCSPPAARARISPRMYDSVKRLEPTFTVSAWTCGTARSSKRKNRRKLGGAPHPARGRIAEELQRGEARVKAVLAHQLGVASFGDDHAALHHDDAVGVLDRGEAV